MDVAFANMAAIKFEDILNQIRSSSLNFRMNVTPFTAVIHLKKTITKDKSGNFLHQNTFVNRTNNVKEADELMAKNLALEKEIADLKRSCLKASESITEIERNLEILNRQHGNVNMENCNEDEDENYDRNTDVNEENYDEDKGESENMNEDGEDYDDEDEDDDEDGDEDDNKNENEDYNENEEEKEENEDKNGNEEENETADSGINLNDSLVRTPRPQDLPVETFYDSQGKCNFCPRVFMHKWEYNGHRLREHNICKNCKRFIEPKGQHRC